MMLLCKLLAQNTEGWRVEQVWEFQDDQSFVAIKFSSMHSTIPCGQDHIQKVLNQSIGIRGVTQGHWSFFIQACSAGSWWRQCPGKDGPEAARPLLWWHLRWVPVCTEGAWYKGGLRKPTGSTKDYSVIQPFFHELFEKESNPFFPWSFERHPDVRPFAKQ